jgi:hypothetical protein
VLYTKSRRVSRSVATALRMTANSLDHARDYLGEFFRHITRKRQTNGEFLQWLADRSITAYMRTRDCIHKKTARSTARSGSLISRKATAIAAPQVSNSTTAAGVIAIALMSTSEPANVVGHVRKGHSAPAQLSAVLPSTCTIAQTQRSGWHPAALDADSCDDPSGAVTDVHGAVQLLGRKRAGCSLCRADSRSSRKSLWNNLDWR